MRRGEASMPGTLAEKLWESHVVRRADGEPDLLYIDLHLVHEVTSPQAFDGLRMAGRRVRRPDKTLATADHNVPTDGTKAARLIADRLSRVEVEHVLATQCMVQKRPKTMRILYSGELGPGVTPKDLILATIGRLGTGGMVGHAVEYAGPPISALSMEGRMTICNMTIEGGGRA